MIQPCSQEEWFAVVHRNREQLAKDIEEKRAERGYGYIMSTGETDTTHDGLVEWLTDGNVILPEGHAGDKLTYVEFTAQLLKPDIDFVTFMIWPDGVEIPERALEVLQLMDVEPGRELDPSGPLYWCLDVEHGIPEQPHGGLSLSYRSTELLAGNWLERKVGLVERGWSQDPYLDNNELEPLIQLFLNTWPWAERRK